jgi:hypothetical protein
MDSVESQCHIMQVSKAQHDHPLAQIAIYDINDSLGKTGPFSTIDRLDTEFSTFS